MRPGREEGIGRWREEEMGEGSEEGKRNGGRGVREREVKRGVKRE